MADGNLSTGKIVAGVFFGLFLFFVVLPMAMCGGCAALAGIGAASSDRPRSTSTAVSTTPTAPPAEVVDVRLTDLLRAYEENEVRADANYKGKVIRTTGKVGDVKKGLLDEVYITVGTGKKFEIPQVQCFVEDAAAATAFNPGQKITVEGRADGLMMNVILQDCQISH